MKYKVKFSFRELDSRSFLSIAKIEKSKNIFHKTPIIPTKIYNFLISDDICKMDKHCIGTNRYT